MVCTPETGKLNRILYAKSTCTCLKNESNKTKEINQFASKPLLDINVIMEKFIMNVSSARAGNNNSVHSQIGEPLWIYRRHEAFLAAIRDGIPLGLQQEVPVQPPTDSQASLMRNY